MFKAKSPSPSRGGLGWGWVLAAALLAACGGGGDGGTGSTPATNPPQGSAVIGRDGGTVTSADGKVKLVIPAGALGNSETITIESIDPAKMPSAVAGADLAYDMKPDGLRFAQPAQISVALPTPARQADGSINLKLGALVNSSRAGIEALGDQTITVDGRANTTSISGSLTHFSAVAFGNRLRAQIGRVGPEVGALTTTLVPIPDRLTVGTTYRASFEVAAEGFGASETVSGEFAYKDQSRAPLRHIPDMASIGPDSAGFFPLAGPPTLRTPARLGNYGDYVCDRPATVVTDVQLRLANASVLLGYVDAEVPLQDLKVQWYYGHVCEFTGPPPPPPPSDGAQVVPVPPFVENLVVLTSAMGLSPAQISALFRIPVDQVQWILLGAFGNPGLRLIDMRDGKVVSEKDLPGSPMFGVVPHLKDGKGCLFGYGSGTARTCFFPDINDFGLTEIGFGLGTDAGLLSSTPVSTPTGLRHLLWYAVNGTVTQEYQPTAGGEVETRRLFYSQSSNGWYAAGGAPTGKPQSAYFNANADRVLVVRGEPGAPGQLWFGNPADPAGGMLVGLLGTSSNDARKIRCVLPICAVSSFGGLVSIVTWDGTNAPAIAGTIAGTTGAVGIDVAVEGANRTIRSADFTNNTVTKTIVTAAGQVVSSVTKAVPQGCTNPGHVTSFTDAGGQRKSVVSCNGRNAQGQSAVAVLTDAEFFGLQ